MQFINKYKYDKKIISATVNEMATDALKAGAFQLSTHSDDLSNFYQVAQSDYLQDIYNERKFNKFIISPKQLEIINDGNTLKYTYVPFRQICEKYIQSNAILSKIIAEQSTTFSRETDLFSSISDGSVSKERCFNGKLKFEIYVDDVELTPGNGKGKSRKFLQVYASCVDIPFCKRMHQQEIELVMMIDRKKLQRLNLADPLNAVLAPLKEDLSNLSQEGIQLNVDGKNITVSVVLTSLLGDNLGVYELLGRTCSFNSNSFICRFCHAHGNTNRNSIENIQNLKIGMNLLTGKEDQSILSLGQHPFHTFPFASITGVHQWNIAPADIMHDVSEGALPLILELILTSIVEKSKAKLPSYNWGSTKKESIDFIIRSYNSDVVQFYEDTLELYWSEGKFKLQGKATMVNKINFSCNQLFLIFYFFRNEKFM